MALKMLMDSKPKGLLDCNVEFTYFNLGKGRADPLEQMFAHHGQTWSKNLVSPGQGPVGEMGTGLPQITTTIDGQEVKMGQFGAMLRSFGIRYGYYDPKNWE